MNIATKAPAIPGRLGYTNSLNMLIAPLIPGDSDLYIILSFKNDNRDKNVYEGK